MFRFRRPTGRATGHCTYPTGMARGRAWWSSRTRAGRGRRCGRWATGSPRWGTSRWSLTSSTARANGRRSTWPPRSPTPASGPGCSAGSAIGSTGYCLGGRMSLLAAGGLGDKIGAAASFHGGRLAVADDPNSPHLAADRITATVYVAGAVEDDSFTAEQAALLDRALSDAGVDHIVEFYPAHHGFAMADNATYDADAAARHWEALGRLYGSSL